MAHSAALPILTAESGLTRYLEEIRRFPMLEPQEEYMLAKSWREHGDREAAHRLVTSHLRLVAKIAMGYRGYGLPIAEVISEGNVGLMQAVKRFEPEKGFRLATYAMWWIKASIQEYILRSWSLVKMGTTANQKKLFFNLRKAKSKISALEEGDMRPDQVKLIAKRLGVGEQDVIDMNRRLGGDASLNTPIREDGDSGEWQDWLVSDAPSQERVLAENEELDNRRKALGEALSVLNDRERRIFEARPLSTWLDEKALVRWRTHAEHHRVQEKGRTQVFEDYRLRVGEVTADTRPPAGISVEQTRLDETQIGTAKAVTMTEMMPDPKSVAAQGPVSSGLELGHGTAGLVDQEIFTSIYTPGKLVLLASWRDAAAAHSWKPAASSPLRHRTIRIIRDYGMFERREAPQYYPARAPAPA